jgi:predicted signal transduction protein with EAL and GGDEF domain
LIAHLDALVVTFRSIKFPLRDAHGSRPLGGVAINITADVQRQGVLANANVELEQLATTDCLTGLSNRRVFEARAGIEFAAATRKKRPLALLMMDIGNFKRRE